MQREGAAAEAVRLLPRFASVVQREDAAFQGCQSITSHQREVRLNKEMKRAGWG